MSDEQGTEPADDGIEEGEDGEPEGTPGGAETETEPEREPDEEDEAAAEDGLEEGDFVSIEYTVRTVEDGVLVDTTDRETAEEEDIDTEGRQFGPRTIVLGGGYLFDAVEQDMYGKEVGDSGSVTVPAAEAFGEHDPDEVRTISADRIPEDSRHPGAHVHIDGQGGHVETIIGGRARVDFNHPLADEDLEYDYEIVGAVEDRTERAKGLLRMYLDIGDLEMHIETEEEERTVYDEDEEDEEDEGETETVEVDVLYIEATPQLTMNQQWMFSKHQIAQELIERIGVDRVIVQEVLDGMGGLGGIGGQELEEAIESADIDDVDADEIVDELDVEEIGDHDH